MTNSSSSTPLVDAVETELMLRSDGGVAGGGLGNGNGGGPKEIPVISEEDERAQAVKDKVHWSGKANK